MSVSNYLGVFGNVVVLDVSRGREIALEPPQYPWVTGISVAVQEGVETTMSFDLDMPYDKGMEFLGGSASSSEAFSILTHDNYVRMRMGYSDGAITPWYYGKLTEGGMSLSINVDGVAGSITVTTVSDSAYFANVRGKSISSKLHLLQGVVDAIGCKAEIGGDAAERLSRLGGVSYVGGGQSYIETLCEVVARAGCRWWMVPGDSGHYIIRVMSSVDESRAVSGKRFVVRGKFDPANEIYPVFNFSATMNPAMFRLTDPSASSEQESYIDDGDGEVVSVTVTAADNSNPIDANYVESPEPGDVVVEGTQVDRGLEPGESSSVAVPQTMDGESELSSAVEGRVDMNQEGFTATIETVGVPDLEAGTMIEVSGVAFLSGSYRVRGFTHTWSAGEFTTSIDAFRRGVDRTASAEEVPAGGAGG